MQIGSDNGLISFLNRLEDEHNAQRGHGISMNSYLDIRARERGIPISGTFELTPLCNFDCKMCYVHLSSDQLQNSSKKILNGDEWIAIIDQAVEAGLFIALLTGGEAMMHPDFERIFLHLQSKGVQVCVNTNGVLLTKKRIEFFKKHKPKEIRVTLYGANEDTYEKVTGHRLFATVAENLRQAKEAGLDLGVNITPNCYMSLEECFACVEIAESLRIPLLINVSLSEPRKETGRDQKMHDFTLDQYIELYKLIRKMKNEELHTVCEEALPAIGQNHKETRGIQCGAGRSSFSVVWDGNMQPCLSLRDRQCDLRNMSFADAWKDLNRFVGDYFTPRECLGCPYKHLCTGCVVRHAEGAPIGHANPALCIRARRMVAEGLVLLKN